MCTNGAEAIALLEHVATLTRQRAEALRWQGVRKWTPASGQPFVLLVVDELADVIAYQPDNALRKRANLALQSILSQGRAPGVCVIGQLQDPRKEIIDFRHLFPVRIAMRLDEPTQVDMVLIPLPSWAMTVLRRRRLAIASEVQPVFPDSLGGWRDPSNVRRVWRRVRDDAGIEGLVSHTLRKTVASFLDDAAVPTRKISDQLGHSKVSMTQNHYLGRKLTDRQTADVLEKLMGSSGPGAVNRPKTSRDLDLMFPIGS